MSHVGVSPAISRPAASFTDSVKRMTSPVRAAGVAGGMVTERMSGAMTSMASVSSGVAGGGGDRRPPGSHARDDPVSADSRNAGRGARPRHSVVRPRFVALGVDTRPQLDLLTYEESGWLRVERDPRRGSRQDADLHPPHHWPLAGHQCRDRHVRAHPAPHPKPAPAGQRHPRKRSRPGTGPSLPAPVGRRSPPLRP